MIISPDNIINYNRTEAELELLILFLILVAGKSATGAEVRLEQFLDGHLDKPFDYIRELIKNKKLLTRLVDCRTGQYTKIQIAFEQITLYTGNELRTISVQDLELVHGIGPKSARCFVSWTRPGTRYAMLDTHILKYLRDVLNIPNVPKSTPSGKKYLELEKIFLDHAEALNRIPAELDLEIWRSYRI